MGSFEPKKASFTGGVRSQIDADGTKRTQISGGRFDFEDGGTYCGGWDDGKAHGHGICTGPKHQGAFSGAWSYGFEVSGAYIWPSGSHYIGQWQNGRRHGLGVEHIGRQIYRGEWSKDGHKGRYGTRESTVSTARYEGTWNMGYQDGYGCETYADGGKYQGQWLEGKRHGYGIRTSAPFGLASHYRRKETHSSMSSLRSLDTNDVDKNRSEEIRGGFVLTAKSDKIPTRRNSLTEKSKKGFLSGFKIRKQKSTGDLEKRGTLASSSVRSTTSTSSWLSTGSEQSNLTSRSTHTDSNASFTMEDEQLDSAVIETYMGEWKKDKRCGHGVAERSDGLRYEGEWYSNKKHGYGVTTFRDGAFEEGKYKNNVLITSQKKKHLFLARSRKFRDRINIAVNSAQRALKMAMQRSDIAISRTSTASERAQNANIAADQALIDCENAVKMAREFSLDFKPSVLERFEKLRFTDQTKFLTLIGNNNLIGYSVNPKYIQQHLPITSELGKSKNSQSILKELDLQQTKLNVTPQTDFVDLVDQQNRSGNIHFDKAYYSQTKQSKQLSMKRQVTTQKKETCDFNKNIGTGKNKADVENSSFILSQTKQQNESTEEHERTESKNINYVRNSNSDQHNANTSSNGQAFIHRNNICQQRSASVNHNSSFEKNHTFLSSHFQTQQPIYNEMDKQLSIDYFDHYKRPPSRDSSTDRYARVTSRLSESVGNNSRQPSMDRCFPKQTKDLPSSKIEVKPIEGSTSHASYKNTLTAPLNASITAEEKSSSVISKPFEEFILCQRSLGQDIIPSLLTPKRTESLYTPPIAQFSKTIPGNNFAGSKHRQNISINASIQRKKSLPDFQDLPRATGAMSREEVSALGSARREAVRKQIQINEELRANPLLYLFSPQVKDWFSRQQLLLLVLFLNIILGLIFLRLLN